MCVYDKTISGGVAILYAHMNLTFIININGEKNIHTCIKLLMHKNKMHQPKWNL